jgi:hypothetical protein
MMTLMTSNDDTPTPTSIDDAIALARQELQSLQTRRTQQEKERHTELQDAATRWKTANDAYMTVLSSSPKSIYRNVWKELLRHLTLPPLYVLNIQTDLLLALHSQFVLLPHQTQLLEQEKETLTLYLQDQIHQLLQETDAATHQTLATVSFVAEQNHSLYDHYQTQLDSQQAAIRALHLQLPKDSRMMDGPHTNGTTIVDYTDSDSSESSSSSSEEEEEDGSIGKVVLETIRHFGKSQMMVRV